MSPWVSPEPWSCDVCPVVGYGGKPAKDAHITARHIPEPLGRRTALGPIVPEGVDAADVRAWARANGWDIGNRGRLPQGAIDGYMARQP